MSASYSPSSLSICFKTKRGIINLNYEKECLEIVILEHIIVIKHSFHFAISSMNSASLSLFL